MPIPGKKRDSSRPAAVPAGDAASRDVREANPTIPLRGIFSAETQTAASSRSAEVESSQVQTLGDYELIDQLGAGGMGVVYRARQKTARRMVALKIIRPDRLADLPSDKRADIIERFRTEALASALLSHDNIVTVFDVGSAEGQHFYSMQLVDGSSLTEALLDGPLDGRHAAGYLEQIARAIHEAHSNGILHRDLKPHNILVDRNSDRPLVMDFGLAKFIAADTELTRAGAALGTPNYMSPEQGRDSASATTFSDIYSLGATLYHLLTGRPPFQAADALETLRQVLFEEPAAPRLLNPNIDRDLETMCMKCLEKTPSRRYATCQELADELQRYLNGEPILARPLGPVGRSWRWCRRNKALSVSGAVAASCLLIALLAMSVGFVKTRAAQRESDESFRLARGTVDKFFTRVSEESLLNQNGMQPLRNELLQDALEYYKRFVQQRRNDASLFDDLAKAYYRVGVITAELGCPQDALEPLRNARELFERTHEPDSGRLSTLGDIYTAEGKTLFRLERGDEALQACAKSIEVRQRLVDSEPGNRGFVRKLANAHMNLAVVTQNLGFSADDERQLGGAKKLFELAQQLREKLLLDGFQEDVARDIAKGAYNLADFSELTDDLDAAEQYLRTSVAAYRQLVGRNEDLSDRHDLALVLTRLGDLQAADEAKQSYDAALDLLESLSSENPAVVEFRADLAQAYRSAGVLSAELGEEQAAANRLARATQMLEALGNEDPQTPDYRRELAVTRLARADMHARNEDFEQARGDLKQAIEVLQSLVDRFANATDRQFLNEVRRQLDELPEPVVADGKP